MPAIGPGLRLHVLDIKDRALDLSMAPILHMAQSIGFVRGADGAGYFSVEGENATRAVAYVFKTGEIWLVDSWLAQVHHVELDEEAFVETLKKCSDFLSRRLELSGPYQWRAGFEGIFGRMLVLPQNDRPRGTAVENVISASGRFTPGKDPAKALRPFFERVFDCFGLRRPSNVLP